MAQTAEDEPFDFEKLMAEAARLAGEDFEPNWGDIPEELGNLTYDQYRAIWFKPEAAIWSDQQTQFRIDLFHPGFIYKQPVDIAFVEEGAAKEFPFSSDLFAYGHLVSPPQPSDLLHYTGFRARYPINSPSAFQEFTVFQGASYFRAVGRRQIYGLSARGLAINTAEPEGEEFPAFRKYWIEKPAPDSDTLVVNALLDSQSVAGAYRFEITPGAETVMEVTAALFLRQPIKKLGLAPMTSMFLFNPMNRAGFDDYRRAVHDSDGLQMLSGTGEWIWRPLSNPADLQLSGFADRTPRGFGLMQRARRYTDFEDAEAKYEQRPCLWIEPIDDWGAGVVELVEIPTDQEINDNIVAYWRPAGAIPADRPLRYRYRMRWTSEFLPPPELLYVASSRAGETFDQQRRLFVLDFTRAGDGNAIDSDGLAINVSASSGEIANPLIHAAEPNGALRVSFELNPGSEEMSELRLFLTRDGEPASETWLYRWTAS